MQHMLPACLDLLGAHARCDDNFLFCMQTCSCTPSRWLLAPSMSMLDLISSLSCLCNCLHGDANRPCRLLLSFQTRYAPCSHAAADCTSIAANLLSLQPCAFKSLLCTMQPHLGLAAFLMACQPAAQQQVLTFRASLPAAKKPAAKKTTATKKAATGAKKTVAKKTTGVKKAAKKAPVTGAKAPAAKKTTTKKAAAKPATKAATPAKKVCAPARSGRVLCISCFAAHRLTAACPCCVGISRKVPMPV